MELYFSSNFLNSKNVMYTHTHTQHKMPFILAKLSNIN